jgi:BASS family bile acid:Na+ symporter
MFGLGLSLRVADFRRVIVFPRAVAVALVCQTVVLPPVCLGIAHAFALPPELAVGLMLLAASPGGPAANLYSHLARGDVALNITLTAVNGLLSLVTLPLILGFALHHFLGSDQSIPLLLSNLILVIALVIMPVAIGLIVRARRPEVADRFDRAVRLASMAFLALVVVAAVFAIVIAVNVLDEPAMSIPPAVYAIISLLTAAVMGVIVARQRPQGQSARSTRQSPSLR